MLSKWNFIIAAAGLLFTLVELFLPLDFRLEFLYLLLDLSSCLPPKTRHDNVFVVLAELAELLVIRVERLDTNALRVEGVLIRVPDQDCVQVVLLSSDSSRSSPSQAKDLCQGASWSRQGLEALSVESVVL